MLPRSFTNEEVRVNIYDSPPTSPTDSSTVTHDTQLDSLNLNWTEKDLPERERTKHVHRLHPYLGKYIPQLVEIFLRKYFDAGDTVLDPFCGSGTTLVQANELGIDSVGYDISAFNVLLSSVKTGQYDSKKLRQEVIEVLNKVIHQFDSKKAQISFLSSPFSFSDDFQTDDYLTKWFSPIALSQLLLYVNIINSGNYEYKDLLKVILSRSARSSRMTSHFDLDFPKVPQTEPYWCHKHFRICQPTTDALKFLTRYSIDTINRIEEYAKLRTNSSVSIIHGDSRTLESPPINGIITSPPYVGLIDYHEQHAYAYSLLKLQDKRADEIGSATNGNSKKMKEQYQIDIAKVLCNAMTSLKSGGYIIVVAHDRSNLYPTIAQSIGVIEEAIVQRHVNRRTGRRNNAFFESIYIWRKP